jgi:hypothetical protein
MPRLGVALGIGVMPALRRLPVNRPLVSGLLEAAVVALSLTFALEDAVLTTVSSGLPKVNDPALPFRCATPVAEASCAVDRPNWLPTTPGLFAELKPGAPLLSLASRPISPGLFCELNPGREPAPAPMPA